MRYAFELDPKKWELIQELLREGRYETVAQFVAVAIENQFQLEAIAVEQGAMSLAGQSTNRTNPDLPPKLSSPGETPALVQAKEGTNDEIVWGLYNRIFPVKITLRVLAQLLVSERSKTIELRMLRDEAALQARRLGKELALKDRSRAHGRSGKLATGLPFRRGDKSLDRFKNMFVGTVSNKGKSDGFPALLKFVVLQKLDGHAVASLTPAGYKFSSLENPILDELPEASRVALSTAESDFYTAHILDVLPREWDICCRILEGIPDGNDSPDSVDGIIRGSVPGLNPSLIAATRAGIISRLDELGLVQRRQDGLRVSYSLTKRGEVSLKSMQKVATHR